MTNKQQRKAFRLGLIVNPVAGICGSVALKGSDGADPSQIALSQGVGPLANQRDNTANEQDSSYYGEMDIFTLTG